MTDTFDVEVTVIYRYRVVTEESHKKMGKKKMLEILQNSEYADIIDQEELKVVDVISVEELPGEEKEDDSDF